MQSLSTTIALSFFVHQTQPRTVLCAPYLGYSTSPAAAGNRGGVGRPSIARATPPLHRRVDARPRPPGYYPDRWIENYERWVATGAYHQEANMLEQAQFGMNHCEAGCSKVGTNGASRCYCGLHDRPPRTARRTGGRSTGRSTRVPDAWTGSYPKFTNSPRSSRNCRRKREKKMH